MEMFESRKDHILSEQLLRLRKQHHMTQEMLAERLGVTFQAVSKWENGNSYPDIMLLPHIADVFGVTLDELFGRCSTESVLIADVENTVYQEQESTFKQDIPFQASYDVHDHRNAANVDWPDDQLLRIVMYRGQQLLDEQHVKNSEVIVHYRGEPLNVYSHLSIQCGDVLGSVDAGTHLQCKDIHGNASAGSDLYADDVFGNVQGGRDVQCKDVTGSVIAGRDLVSRKE
ncbi:helix-turn-helix domain-containing protein [Paenibacillus sp. WLX1005]|uniref:helix-turn-helix domain-containing protein n=1 Tax=Paenibacillus sp. WLX1005 TaxID=3243766 RepID=UPI0039843ECA